MPAQIQFRSDDTIPWGRGFENGADGFYNPSTGTDSPVNSSFTGTSGAFTGTVGSGTGFVIGQSVILHQTQGTGATTWQLNYILNVVGTTLTFAYPLVASYTTGAQAYVMKKYSAANIGGAATISSTAWNGTTGSILAFFCNGIVTIDGALVLNSKGFRGGNNWNGVREGQQGEGTVGVGSNVFDNRPANGNGGGSATENAGSAATAGGGAGGGNGAQGTDGSNGAGAVGTNNGFGGLAVGDVGLVTMAPGGGGGQGGGQNSAPGAGGPGGGILLIIARTIKGAGTIGLNGGNGVAAGLTDGGGGGGAGGSALFKGINVNFSSLTVTANAGAGGAGAGTAGAGGAGAVGRIHVDSSNPVTGVTTPTANTRLDNFIGRSSNNFGAML